MSPVGVIILVCVVVFVALCCIDWQIGGRL